MVQTESNGKCHSLNSCTLFHYPSPFSSFSQDQIGGVPPLSQTGTPPPNGTSTIITSTSSQIPPPLSQPPPLLRPAPPLAPPSLLRQPPPLQTRPLQTRPHHNHPPPPLIRPAVASTLHQGTRNSLGSGLTSTPSSMGQHPPSLVGLKVESSPSH